MELQRLVMNLSQYLTENIDQTNDCALVCNVDIQQWFRLGEYHTNNANIVRKYAEINSFNSKYKI